MLGLCLKRSLTAWHRVPGRLQWLCTANDDQHLELKQLKNIKSDEFYDRHGQKRRYFYYIDLQVSGDRVDVCLTKTIKEMTMTNCLQYTGPAVLEDTRPKNIATSLKSAKFLQFFFSQVRLNSISQCKSKEEEKFLEYPYRSPCGKEMNFIKCADRPFVFDNLQRDEKSAQWTLVFGGGELTMPFRPEMLRISLSTGRLYHDIQTKHVSPETPEGLALVRSQLAVELGKHIDVYDFPNDFDAELNVNALKIGHIEWENRRYSIHAIE